MSDGSCSGPFRFHDDQYLDNYSPLESTEFDLRANTPTMENIKNPEDIVITAVDDVEVVAAVEGGAEQVDVANNEEQLHSLRGRERRLQEFGNIFVLDGLGEIEDIIHNVRESVKHVNASPGRLHIFSELAKQLSMSKKHLILDVTTRWNATYAMLSTALDFKEVFVNYADRESTYTTLPSEEDWKKVEDVCSFLALFNKATKIISGSEYPTSNLFLSELFGIKEALDAVVLDGSDYMMAMAMKMKRKFDKYWGTCNLLISIGAVLDPMYKMKLLEFSFISIYSPDEAPRQMKIIRDILCELYQEYIDAHKAANIVSTTEAGGSQGVSVGGTSMSGFSSLTSRFGKGIKTSTAKYDQHIRSVDTFASAKS
ncbi:hypothetical protein V6N13_091363 [Hibiscus sabdariffa]